MSYDTEDKMEKLTKYRIIKGVSIISIIHRETKEFLYNFFHPMSRIRKETLAEAEEVTQELDLFYGDMKVMRLSENSEILFYEGSKVRLMVILKPNTITQSTSPYIEKIFEKFLYEFEAKFSDVLKEFNGDTSQFQEADKMLFDYLGVDYTFPHHAKYRGFDPEDPLEDYMFKAADVFTRKIGYFYLDNLLFLTKDYVRDKAREEGKNPDEIDFPPVEDFYLAMFKLKKMGMLEKIENFKEELNLYSKIKY